MPSRVAAVPDLERELDELYGLPLEQFTSARNSLASRLKKAHQAEAAAAVQSLRKPSVVVWTANQLARNRPELVAELVDAGEQLREVQQRALGGDGVAGVTEAAARERAAVHALLSGTDVSAQARDRLAQTLHAAAVDPDAADLLMHGRLTAELDAVGFGSLHAVPGGTTRASKLDAARERVAELRQEARRLDRQARTTEIAAQQATIAAETARRDADRAASELALAEAELKKR